MESYNETVEVLEEINQERLKSYYDSPIAYLKSTKAIFFYGASSLLIAMLGATMVWGINAYGFKGILVSGFVFASFIPFARWIESKLTGVSMPLFIPKESRIKFGTKAKLVFLTVSILVAISISFIISSTYDRLVELFLRITEHDLLANWLAHVILGIVLTFFLQLFFIFRGQFFRKLSRIK